MQQSSLTSDTTTRAHGGRVFAAARRWHIDPADIIDFSANINPLGPPQSVLTAIENALTPVNLRIYPDTQVFVHALSDKHRVTPDEIVVGSGTASLMFAALHAVLPKRVLILEPAFAEYARACFAAHAEVTTVRLNEDNSFTPDFARLVRAVEERQFDLLILNSPHNPTGAVYHSEDLSSLITAAETHNVTVMLDEAFIDYAPENSMISQATTNANLIVLRSLTKFYSLPGLRVGYAVCATPLAARINKQLDPWSVSTVALEAGLAALEEHEFARLSRRANADAREEFGGALRSAGLHVFPSAANFVLAKLPSGSGAGLEEWLERKRILIRRCDSFRGLSDEYLRLAVRSREDNARLARLIDVWLKGLRG